MIPKNRTLEGKNRTLGGEGGVKNRRKSSDIIYVRSLTQNNTKNIITKVETKFSIKKMKNTLFAVFLSLFTMIEGRPQENPGIFDFCSAYASSYEYVYEKMLRGRS